MARSSATGCGQKCSRAHGGSPKRHERTGHPDRVELDLIDELGRQVHAEGQCLNGLGFFLNPNLYTVNCLTEWAFEGITAFGEDHDNWSATGIRRFLHGRTSGTVAK